MVVIISRQDDQSTCDVMDWLFYYGETVIRINENEKINSYELIIDGDISSFKVKFERKEVNLLEVDSFWFRRGGVGCDFSIYTDLDTEWHKKIENHLLEECKTIEDFLIAIFQNKKSLGNYYQGNANKLISLYTAVQVGLKIPKTVVTTNKKSLTDFHENNNPCITKFIQDVLSFSINNNERYFTTTSKVTNEDIEKMGISFFPSQLQMEISKRYELRIFYLREKCYAMAIFSQEDEKTKLDFRNYNHTKPNRNVPYKLPVEIENKLILFMNKMHLDTGSIDMIFTTDFEYVFLEVNPVGQYDMVSVPCNYYLHKKIAKYLSDAK